MIGLNSRLYSINETITCNTSIDGIFYNDQLVDDGSAYSAMGEVKLKLLQTQNPSENHKMKPKSIELNQYTYFKYGTGDHSSDIRIIRGSVVLYDLTDNSNLVSIRHLVVEVSSQWLIVRKHSVSNWTLHMIYPIY